LNEVDCVKRPMLWQIGSLLLQRCVITRVGV
jgi:hypothetical protein